MDRFEIEDCVGDNRDEAPGCGGGGGVEADGEGEVQIVDTEYSWGIKNLPLEELALEVSFEGEGKISDLELESIFREWSEASLGPIKGDVV